MKMKSIEAKIKEISLTLRVNDRKSFKTSKASFAAQLRSLSLREARH